MFEIIARYEFDSHPDTVGAVELCLDVDEIFVRIKSGGNSETVLSAIRDQWGVWYETAEGSVAQEDGTRSFLDALIQALQKMRYMNEVHTEPATLQETKHGES